MRHRSTGPDRLRRRLFISIVTGNALRELMLSVQPTYAAGQVSHVNLLLYTVHKQGHPERQQKTGDHFTKVNKNNAIFYLGKW